MWLFYLLRKVSGLLKLVLVSEDFFFQIALPFIMSHADHEHAESFFLLRFISILAIIFWQFTMFPLKFDSPQVKRDLIYTIWVVSRVAEWRDTVFYILLLFYFPGNIISTWLEICTAPLPAIPPATPPPRQLPSTAPETWTPTKSNHDTPLMQDQFPNATLQSCKTPWYYRNTETS